ncbi:NAD(P)H-hydrate epimerase [Aliamphritea spongicola]|nr:NAD(P)H-hydrate epimerase [Aliamphritea spongicola]
MAKSSQLPAALYTAELTRALDAAAISAGMPGFKLMLRAGHVAFDRLMHQWPDVHSLSILCGTGNNGGDGFVMAALAQQQGIQVQVVCVSRLDDFAVQLRGEARQAYDWMCDQGVECHRYRLGMNLQGR